MGEEDRQTVDPPVVGEGPRTRFPMARLGKGLSSVLAKGRQILPLFVQGVLSFLRLHAGPVHGSRDQHGKVTHSGPHSQDLSPLSQPPNPVLIPLPRPWASCHHFKFFPAFGGRFCDEREGGYK